jgi:hypothetical protein
MWVRAHSGRLINLDMIETVMLNPMATTEVVACPRGEGGAYVLGKFKDKRDAEHALEHLSQAVHNGTAYYEVPGTDWGGPQDATNGGDS